MSSHPDLAGFDLADITKSIETFRDAHPTLFLLAVLLTVAPIALALVLQFLVTGADSLANWYRDTRGPRDLRHRPDPTPRHWG